MNTLKRTLALVATLAMATTAFVGCGSSDSSSSTSEAATDASTDAATEGDTEADTQADTEADTEGDTEAATDAPATPAGSTEVGDVQLATGGSTVTFAAWNADDVPALIASWKGETDFAAYKEKVTNGEVAGIDFVNFNCGGGDAAEKYNQLFNEGKDLDVYFVEADWALQYINDDERTAPLEKLGFTDANFADIYGYTDDIGKDANGVRKGVSWQAAAGGFAYRADLAEQYLGVKSPEEMQEKIGDWDKFVEAAKTISEATDGKTALADSLGGMWQAFAAGRKTPWVQNDVVSLDDSCEKFADVAKQLWDCGGVTQNNQWVDAAWTGSGATGACMGYFVSTWGYGGFFLDAAGGVGGDTYGKWAVCQGPVPYFWGGTWIVVNPKTDNAEEARDFIKAATVDADKMAAYAQAKPEYVNNKAVMDKLIADDVVFNADITGNFVDNQNIYAVLADNAKSIDFNGLITPYDATLKGDFINAVKEEILVGGGTYEDATEAFLDKASIDLPGLNWD